MLACVLVLSLRRSIGPFVMQPHHSVRSARPDAILSRLYGYAPATTGATLDRTQANQPLLQLPKGMFYPEADSCGMVVGDADPHGKTARPVHPNLNPMFPSLRFQSE